MTSTQVTLREFSQLLIKYVGKPLSDNTFNAQHTLVCRIICALELSYPLLPSPEGNSDVCRLKSVCAALIDSTNRLVDDKTGLVYEYGHLIASSRILSARCKDLLASVSSSMAQNEENNVKITELTESERLLKDKVRDLESQISTITIKHQNDLYDNENFHLQFDHSEEANACLQETIDRLNEQLAEKDLNLNDLYDLLAGRDKLIIDKDEWINTLRYDLSVANDLVNDLKRGASDDPNQTPSKKPSQGYISRVASPSSLTDVAKMDLNPFSSEDEDDASEDPGPSPTDNSLPELIIVESDEEKEPEDDGHPEAGNSAAEIRTPELPIFAKV